MYVKTIIVIALVSISGLIFVPLIIYEFAGTSVQFVMGGEHSQEAKVLRFGEGNITMIPWLKDSVTNIQLAKKYCPALCEHCSCQYRIPILPVYQTDSVISQLELASFPGLHSSKDYYMGNFEYNETLYGVRIEKPQFSNFLLYGFVFFVSSIFTMYLIQRKKKSS